MRNLRKLKLTNNIKRIARIRFRLLIFWLIWFCLMIKIKRVMEHVVVTTFYKLINWIILCFIFLCCLSFLFFVLFRFFRFTAALFRLLYFFALRLIICNWLFTAFILLLLWLSIALLFLCWLLAFTFLLLWLSIAIYFLCWLLTYSDLFICVNSLMSNFLVTRFLIFIRLLILQRFLFDN